MFFFQTDILRTEFDKEVQSKKNINDAEHVLNLTAKLCYFCNVKQDGQRLVIIMLYYEKETNT